MFTAPGPDDLSTTFANKPKLTSHGITLLETAYKKVGAKVNPACPSFNRATDEAAATERIAELTTLLELKYDGTALIFGVRMSPLVAEMYVRLMLAMGGEHVGIVGGKHAEFLKKAACSMWTERLQLWTGFQRVTNNNGCNHDFGTISRHGTRR